MRVLVTGAGGYLGSVLCESLLTERFEVSALDLEFLTPSPVEADPKYQRLVGDTLDPSLLKDLLKKCDVVLPLAGVVGTPACEKNPELAWSINADAAKLIEALRSRSQRVVYPMTNVGYECPESSDYCDENSSFNPQSVYGRSKKKAEEMFLAGGNAVSLRLASVFGVSPRMRLDVLIHHFLKTALTEGTITLYEKKFKRNFVHIRDVADAFIFALKYPKRVSDGIYNLTLEQGNLSKCELASLVQKFVPSLQIRETSEMGDPDQRNFFVLSEKLKRAGFQASRSLESGMAEVLDWFLNQPDFQSQILAGGER